MKKASNFLFFILFIFLILTNTYEIIESIKLSFSICINKLFPSLIPFMLFSNILINYDFINDISDILNKLMTKVFKVNKNCSFVFIMSILSGSPSNGKFLKDLLDNKLITINDCQNCLNFIHYTNPLFVLGTIGYTFFNSKQLGLIILISSYLSSFILGIFNKKKEICNYTTKKIENNKNFFNILNKSILSTINTLLLILGIITTFLIITCIINCLFDIDKNYKFIYGILEITQGLNYLSISNININIKAIISSFFISFGGLCIHMQVFSILDNKKIRYIPYLISRILHGIISSIITFIILKLYN